MGSKSILFQVRSREIQQELIVQGGFDGGANVEEVICEVILPALRSIGDEWANGRLEVYEEHRASGVVSSLLGRMQGLPSVTVENLEVFLLPARPLKLTLYPQLFALSWSEVGVTTL